MTTENTNSPHFDVVDSELPPGTRVGEYVIDALIGAGGFGCVYRAEHPLIGKKVAIKVLAKKLSVDPAMVSRFIAEARSVNQIQSQYIIDIFGFGQLDDGRQYYIMELLDGLPLDKYINEYSCVPLIKAISILRGIGRALDAAHRNGVAHRDLKPENVFLVEDDQRGYRPVLLDFGIAKLLGEKRTLHKTRTGAPIGTPFYMSPEQCRGRDVDHRTDIYAFGCMTYRMLTGRVPFDGEGYTDILFKQIQEEPRPPTEFNANLPSETDAVIAKMMAKDPNARYKTLADAVRALETAAYAGGTLPEIGGDEQTTGQQTPQLMTDLSSSPTLAAPELDFDPEGPLGSQTRGRSWWWPLLTVSALLLSLLAVWFFLIRDQFDANVLTAGEGADAAAHAVLAIRVDAAALGSEVVTVTISGTPQGTEVVWGPQGVVGIAPGNIQWVRGPAPRTLVFRKRGYVSVAKDIVFDIDKRIVVEMEALTSADAGMDVDRGYRGGRDRDKRGPRRGGTGRRQGRDSLEEPFLKSK